MSGKYLVVCDLCGAQKLAEMSLQVEGMHALTVMSYHLDVCEACLEKPIRELLDTHIKRTQEVR